MNETPKNRPPRRRLWRWILILLVIGAGAEIALRWLTPETKFLSPHTDDYWKAALHQQLTTTQPEALLPPDLSFDAKLGWRMKPGYSAGDVHHNSHGYRGKSEYSIEHDNPRTLLLGDSFTYGLGVGDDETWGAHLAKLTGDETINTAVAAHSIDQSLLMWENEAQTYKPDTVILGYAIDKFFTNPLEIRNLPKPWFSIEHGALQLHGVPVPAPETLPESGRLQRPFSLRIVEATRWLANRIKSRIGIGENLERATQLNTALLNELQRSVQANGGQFIVAIIGPCFDGEADNLSAERQIMSACEQGGLTCINIAEAMRNKDYSGFYGSNCHWSPRGHRFAAEKIADFIGKNH